MHSPIKNGQQVKCCESSLWNNTQVGINAEWMQGGLVFNKVSPITTFSKFLLLEFTAPKTVSSTKPKLTGKYMKNVNSSCYDLWAISNF